MKGISRYFSFIYVIDFDECYSTVTTSSALFIYYALSYAKLIVNQRILLHNSFDLDIIYG